MRGVISTLLAHRRVRAMRKRKRRTIACRCRGSRSNVVEGTVRSRQKPPSVSVCWLRQHASSQLAPPRATCSAPMAWALRARAPAAAQSWPSAARSAPMVWALRARAPACAPADNARVASWWWACRCRRRRALCAAREARCTRRFALLPSARVGRGVSDIIMHKRAGERLRATAACAV